jgi:hypothetical protein
MAILRPSHPTMTTVVASPPREPKALLKKSSSKAAGESTVWWNNMALLRAALVIMLVVAFNANLYFFSVFENFEDSIKVEQMAIEMELRGNELQKYVGESETKLRSHVQALEEKIEGLTQKSRNTQTHKIYLDLRKPDESPVQAQRRLKGSRIHLESPIQVPKGDKGDKKSKGDKKEKGDKKKGDKKDKGAKKEKKKEKAVGTSKKDKGAKGPKDPKGDKKKEKAVGTSKKDKGAKGPKGPKGDKKTKDPKESLNRNSGYFQATY